MTASESADQPYATLRELAGRLLSKSFDVFSAEPDALPRDLLNSQIILKSADKRVVYVSADLKERFFASDQLASIDESSLVKHTSANLLTNADQLVLQDGRSLTVIFEAHESNGGAVRLLNHRIPLVGPDSLPVGILSSYADTEPINDGSAVDLDLLVARFETLDERERQVAQMLSRGVINKQLAARFNVSVRSIENWRRALLNKLDAETIADLTRNVVRFEDFGLMPKLQAES